MTRLRKQVGQRTSLPVHLNMRVRNPVRVVEVLEPKDWRGVNFSDDPDLGLIDGEKLEGCV
jgi:hypothetical protein